jgi:peptidoglycan/LPS O-acetylase OafA/YrhL
MYFFKFYRPYFMLAGNKKIVFLEGLRGIAALIVVLNHLQISFLVDLEWIFRYFLNAFIPEPLTEIWASLLMFFFNGRLSVHIFWVLSAYVISIKLFSAGGEATDTKNYLLGIFSKRYFRLLIPCLVSVIFAWSLLSFNLMYNARLGERLGGFYSEQYGLSGYYSFVPDFFRAMKSVFWDSFFKYTEKTSYNAVLWTMKYEFIGSILCFALYGITKFSKKRYLVYAAIVVVSILMKEYWFLCFLFGFFLSDWDYSGSSRASLFEGLKFKFTLPKINQPLMLVVFLVLIVCGRLVSTYSVKLFPHFDPNIYLSIFLVYLTIRTEKLNAFFSKKPFVWLGKVSFSLYVIHYPIICSFSCLLYLFFDFHSQIVGFCVVSIITIPLCLVLSQFYWRYIDEGSVKISGKVGNYFSK